MIRLRNEAEQIIELGSSGATLPTTATNNIAVAISPGSFYVKAVMGRLAAAPTGSTVVNVVRNSGGVKTTIATLTFASAFVPTYSAVQAAPFSLAKGDVLELDLTSALAAPGGGLAVDVSVIRKYNSAPNDGAIQTDTVLGSDADAIF